MFQISYESLTNFNQEKRFYSPRKQLAFGFLIFVGG